MLCLSHQNSECRVEDVDFIVGIDTNPDLWRFDDHFEWDKEKVKKGIVEKINSDWYRHYIIKMNDSAKTPIGIFYIWKYVESRKSWEIGYCILSEYQQQGYCSEAASIVLKHAFEDFGAHKVVAMCNAFNGPSFSVLENLSFKREGIFRQKLPWGDKWADQYFYALLDSEYQ